MFQINRFIILDNILVLVFIFREKRKKKNKCVSLKIQTPQKDHTLRTKMGFYVNLPIR